MEVRKLNKENFQEVHELMLSRDKFVGIPDSELPMFRLLSEKALRDQLSETQTVATVLGVYDSGVLLGISFSSVSNNQPCWFLSKIHTKDGCGKEIISRVFDATVSHYEDRKLFRFFTLSSYNHLNAYGKILGGSKLHQSYYVYTDEVVGPGDRTENQDFWFHLYMQMTLNYTSAVRGFVKKGRE